LPELIEEVMDIPNMESPPKYITVFEWKTYEDSPLNIGNLVLPREWLWIVAECEKTLDLDGRVNYINNLRFLLGQELKRAISDVDLMFTTWQQRGIAYLKTIGKIKSK
jgi:hypothetical protein